MKMEKGKVWQMKQAAEVAVSVKSIRPVNLLFSQCGMSCCFQYKHHLIQQYPCISLLERLTGVWTSKEDTY